MNAMSVVLFAPASHPERTPLRAALEAGYGPTLLATTVEEAVTAWRSARRSLVILDLRGADDGALAAAHEVHRACRRARSLSLLPRELRGAPGTDAVLRPPIYLDEVVRWCRAAALGPLAEEILEDLSAGLSHEIGNPLTSLFLQIELLKADPGLDTVSEHLDLIEESARRIQTVVQDVARAAGRQPVRADATRLDDLLRHATEALAERSPELTERLDVTCEDADMRVDRGLLAGALSDLWAYLLHAGDASDRLMVHAARSPDGAVRIRHRAAASRLPPDAAGRLFTPLWARQALGLPEGISLTSARNAFRRHGGELRARTDGDGLLVEASLPAASQSSLEFGT